MNQNHPLYHLHDRLGEQIVKNCPRVEATSTGLENLTRDTRYFWGSLDRFHMPSSCQGCSTHPLQDGWLAEGTAMFSSRYTILRCGFRIEMSASAGGRGQAS